MANRRQQQQDVLTAEKNLDANDNSLRAQQIRETADMVRDHQESEAFANRGNN